MSEEELRLECLKLAHTWRDDMSPTPEETMVLAERFLTYVLAKAGQQQEAA